MEVLSKMLESTYDLKEGKTSWRSPSNIALIKYWGKYADQIPANPSLSFSLKNSFSETSIAYRLKKKADEISLDFLFEGKENPAFKARLEKFINGIHPYFSFLSNFHLTIDSKNSFPHSSGIASSASAMSALVLNLMDMYNELTGSAMDKETFFRASSYFSRLASGSAARSVYGGYTVWGESEHFTGSSDLYAVRIDESIDPIFQSLHDDVLIIEKGAKKVSSSAGHALMNNHPFGQARFELARKRMGEIKSILTSGDLNAFGELIESEALILHAMMMASRPYFILFRPNTLAVMEKIWEIRGSTGLQIYFTLDAGANIHLIYPEEIKTVVSTTIKDHFLAYCENATYLRDGIGSGPVNLRI
ncbi:MAG: diphosphomevalonate decarboxylase [Vicingaceae bacterium]